mgnify:CR=1 FL=1|jgi:hypothetical protein|nr:MAG TPA: hypothetical protein [Caudoviricetes sp.]
MVLTAEEKQALLATISVLSRLEQPVPAFLASKIIGDILQANMTPRELLEDIGKQIANDHDHEAAGCSCMDRHQFMLDVCTHLEKQKLSNEIIGENLTIAAKAWNDFEEEFGRAPTPTYLHSQYVIETGVAGVYFIHPAAQQ